MKTGTFDETLQAWATSESRSERAAATVFAAILDVFEKNKLPQQDQIDTLEALRYLVGHPENLGTEEALG